MFRGRTKIQSGGRLIVPKTSWKSDFSMNWSLYLLLIPIAAYFIVFNYLPMFGIVMAFQDFRPATGFFGSSWVGFQHFIDFFTGPSFLQILRNTLVISLLSISVGMTCAVLFSLLLHEVKARKLKRTFQTLSYMPHFVSAVVVAGLLIEFTSSHGIITNIMVSLFGMERQSMLTNPSFFWGINLGADLWQGIGQGSIIFLAALSNVNQEHHEAAAIDGANRLRRVWHINLPAIRPTIAVMLTLRLAMIMNVGADRILLIYNPAIYETADVINTHVARMGVFNMQFGYAAAVGLFNSVIGVMLLILSNRASKKLAETSIF
jgi:putative aldouronate transport system permease protein